MTIQAGTAIAETSKAVPPSRRPFRLGVGRWGLGVYAVLAFVLLLIPIVYTIVFSFNDVRRSNIVWRGFTFDNWINICQQPEVCEAFGNSILVAVIATLLAHPRLLQRPILIRDGVAIIGRPKDRAAAFLAGADV